MAKGTNTAAKPADTSAAAVAPQMDANGYRVNQDVLTFPTDADLRKEGLDSLSARIRRLRALGAKTGTIAQIAVRSNGEHPKYQHVRNVLLTPLKGATQASPAPAAGGDNQGDSQPANA